MTPRYRRYQHTEVIGHGDEFWERASTDILHWAVKTRSGFDVDDTRAVAPGEQLTITARVAFITVREPVEVVGAVRESDRVGYTYRTLPGHPVTGEETFLLHRRGHDVSLTIRSLTAPAPHGFWRIAYPLLRIAQIVARRRYFRALR